jgi:LacI family transcriptional regulator
MAQRSTSGSIFDVARAAGVSIGTVSRVFNDKPDVAEATRALVLETAKRVDYRPRVSRRRVTVGLIIDDIERANQVGFVSDAVSTLTKHMALRGALLEIISMRDLDVLYRNYVRGAIVILLSPDSGPLENIRNLPLLFINNQVEGPRHSFVASDHAQGARIAVRHLLQLGHRRIGFLEVRSDLWGSRERLRGYREAFAAAGLKPPANLARFCEQGPAYGALVSLLAEKPTALLVCGEDLSLEVNRLLLHELDVRIPRDLSVITFETPLVSELLSPPQTTVCQPWEDMGRLAVDNILDLIKGRRDPVRLLLPNRLIERRSTRAV